MVHIQFNFGFYELDRLAGLIQSQLQQRGVVITLHRTLDIEVEGELVSLRSIRSTLERVDRLIVHQQTDTKILADMGLSANVSVVPMGTAPPPEVSNRTRARCSGSANGPSSEHSDSSYRTRELST